MHYTPNENARRLKKGSLKEKRSMNVIVTRDESDPFFTELIRIIEVTSHNHGFFISHIYHDEQLSEMCDRVDNEWKSEVKKKYSEHMKDVDAIFILGKAGKGTVDVLKDMCKHIVALSRNYEKLEVDEVICDGEENARKVIKYLAQMGHQSIAYVGHNNRESRFKGFKLAMLEEGIEYNDELCYGCKANIQHGINAARYFLSMSQPPTGIFCSNDIIAIGLIGEIRKDLYYRPAVISFDDIQEAQNIKPMLSTVHVPKEEMVNLAMVLLNDQFEKGHRSGLKVEVPGKLIIRESSNWSNYN